MGFWPAKSRDKLYKQWSEHSGLPLEAIPKKEVVKETPARVEGSERRLRILYILVGVVILLLCVGVIILLVQVV